MNVRNKIPGVGAALLALLLASCSDSEPPAAASAEAEVATLAQADDQAEVARAVYEGPSAEDIRLAMMRELVASQAVATIQDDHTVLVKPAANNPMTPLMNQFLTVDMANIGTYHKYNRLDLDTCTPAADQPGYLCNFKMQVLITANEEAKDLTRKLNAESQKNPIIGMMLAPMLVELKKMSGSGDKQCTIHSAILVNTDYGWRSPTQEAYYASLREYERKADQYLEAQNRCSTFESQKPLNRSYCSVGGYGYEILIDGMPPEPVLHTRCEWQDVPADTPMETRMASMAPAMNAPASNPATIPAGGGAIDPVPPPPPPDPYKDAKRVSMAEQRLLAVAYAKLSGEDNDAFYTGLLETLNKGQTPQQLAELTQRELAALVPLRDSFTAETTFWLDGNLQLLPQFDAQTSSYPVKYLNASARTDHWNHAYGRLVLTDLERPLQRIRIAAENVDRLQAGFGTGRFHARVLVSAAGFDDKFVNRSPRPVGTLKLRLHEIVILPENVDRDVDAPDAILARYAPDTSDLPATTLAADDPRMRRISEGEFDIRGLRLGMSVTEAERLVREQMPVAVYLKTNPAKIREQNPYQHARVFMTSDRSEYMILYESPVLADTLLGVARYQVVQGVSSGQIADQLQGKYGKPKAKQVNEKYTSWMRWGATADDSKCQGGQSNFGGKLPDTIMEVIENRSDARDFVVLNNLAVVGTLNIFNYRAQPADTWDSCGDVLETEWSAGNNGWLKQSLTNHARAMAAHFKETGEQTVKRSDLNL